MMKKIFIVLALLLTLSACKQEEKILLPVEKMYIMEVNGWYPTEGDSAWMLLQGLIEIDEDFNTKLIKRETYNGDYCSAAYNLTDTLKREIINIVNSYSVDSLYTGEPLIYDGHSYIFLIKKESGEFVRLGGIPHYLPEDLRTVQRELYENLILKETLQPIANQDSVRTYLNGYNEFVFECILPPPPPLPITVKFIPPVIVEDESLF